MTQITQRDIALTISMFLALVLINFTASAAGLTGDNVDDNDIPTLNMSEGQFDFAGNPPDRPLSESEFIIGPGPDTSEHPVSYDLNSSAAVVHFGGVSTDNWTVKLRVNGVIEDEVDIQGNGTVEVIDSNGWRIRLEMLNQQTGEILGDVTESPGGSGGILSFLGDTGDAIFGVVKQLLYFAEVVWYFVLTFVSAAANAFVSIFNVAKWIVSLLGWMFGNFTSLADASDSWATQLVYVPLLVLSAMFAKMALALVSASDWL